VEKLESAATRRARERGYDREPTWYCEFKYTEIDGLGYEEGVHRRDPSSVIQVDGTYYTWYTRSVGRDVGFGSGDPAAKVWPWDQAEVWYATSPDGRHWEERGIAVGRGTPGRYDDRSVFTPEVLAHDGRYYLVYQAVRAPYLRRTKNTIGMAAADSPSGPWSVLDEPILRASDTGEWFGDDDNRFVVKEKGDFDSHKVHDPSLFYYRDKFYLYYKGEIMGEQLFMGGRETKWGVAIADNVAGPYIRSPYNPVTNSGHETCLWQYRGGMAALLNTDGMERNTIQFAPDGVNFEIMAAIKRVPNAAGPFRSGNGDDPLGGISWGLWFDYGEWNYIQRFDLDLRMKENFTARMTYE
jgi:hypothetical protein